MQSPRRAADQFEDSVRCTLERRRIGIRDLLVEFRGGFRQAADVRGCYLSALQHATQQLVLIELAHVYGTLDVLTRPPS